MSTVQRPRATAPQVQQLGAAVLVQGAALHDLVFSLSRGIDDRRKFGKREKVADLEAFRQIAVAAWDMTTPPRHDDVAPFACLRESTAGERDWITTRHAAALAGRSRRQVQRVASLLAGQGDARRVGGAWEVDRVAFSAYLAERQERDSH